MAGEDKNSLENSNPTGMEKGQEAVGTFIDGVKNGNANIQNVTDILSATEDVIQSDEIKSFAKNYGRVGGVLGPAISVGEVINHAIIEKDLSKTLAFGTIELGKTAFGGLGTLAGGAYVGYNVGLTTKNPTVTAGSAIVGGVFGGIAADIILEFASPYEPELYNYLDGVYETVGAFIVDSVKVNYTYQFGQQHKGSSGERDPVSNNGAGTAVSDGGSGAHPGYERDFGTSDTQTGRDNQDRDRDEGNASNGNHNSGGDNLRDGGCFVASTLISLADGSKKPIANILEGDVVLAFDGFGELQPRKVVGKYEYAERKILSVDGVEVTEVHRFLAEDGEYRSIGYFSVGDNLVREDGQLHTIQEIKELKNKEIVFNFTVDDLHTYVADGFRVHNSKPVALDLNGDGNLALVDIEESAVFFDTDGDGYKEKVGWIDAEDGFLVIDKDNDGKIIGDELVIADQTEANDTDIEAVAALYDSNQDGVLDAQDAEFSKFRVWQDLNQNGEVDSGELKTLEDWGIQSVNLNVTKDHSIFDSNQLLGTTFLTKVDGSQGLVGDLAIQTSAAGVRFEEDDGSVTVKVNSGISYYYTKTDTTLNASASSLSVNALFGANQADTLSAGDTLNVVLSGGDNNDNITGGDGDDWLSGDAGNDAISGGKGNDTLFIDSEDNNINGGEGYDVALVSGTSGVTLNLESAQIESAIGNKGNDHFSYLGAAGVTLSGDEGNDTLITGSGNDLLVGGAGADRFSAGAGDDRLFVDAEDNQSDIRAGEGEDWVYVTTNQGVNLDLSVLEAEYAVGNDGDDTFRNNSSNSVFIIGGNGNDDIHGGTGNDVIEGGSGSDILNGGDGGDFVSYESSVFSVNVNLASNDVSGGDAEGDTISNFEGIIGSRRGDTLVGNNKGNVIIGNDGDDTLKGGAGGDYLDGGDGSDTASYEGSNAAVEINLQDGTVSGGHAANDQLLSIENIVGSSFNDQIIGNDKNNMFEGGAGADILTGGEGDDTVSYLSSDAGVTVNLQSQTLSGGHATGDTISGFENVVGSSNGDNLTSNSQGSGLFGLGGDDTITGLEGNDLIEGGAGADNLDGGAGIDALSYENSDVGVSINLETSTASGGHAEGDIISNFENIQGSYHDDILTGNAGDNVIEGDLGADSIDGGQGIDTASYADAVFGVDVNLQRGGGRQHEQLQTNLDASRLSGMVSIDVADPKRATHNGTELSAAFSIAAIGAASGWVTTTVALDRGTDPNAVMGTLLSEQHTLNAGEVSPTNKAYLEVSITGSEALVQFYRVDGTLEGQFTVAVTDQQTHKVSFGYDKYTGQTVVAIDGQIAGSYNWAPGLDVMAGSYGSNGATATHEEADGGFLYSLGLLTDEAVNDTLTNIENLRGSDNGDRLTGDEYANVIEGNDGNDILSGNAGDDTIDLGKGNDTADGGEGVDTAVFMGEAADYAFEKSESGAWKVKYVGTDEALDDGDNLLSNVEFLRFSDRTIDLRDGAANLPIGKSAHLQIDSNTTGQLEAFVVGQEAPLTFALVDKTDNLSVTINSNGSYSINPGGSREQGSFTYSVTDELGNSSEQTVTVRPPLSYETTVTEILEGTGEIETVNLTVDGNSVVVWANEDAGVYLKDLEGQNSTSIKLLDGGNTNINAISLKNGNVAITWHKDVAGENHAFMRIFDVNGTAITSEVQISSADANNSTSSLAQLSNGNIVALWENNNSHNSLYAQSYDLDGNTVGNTIHVGTSSGHISAEVIGVEEGNFVVARSEYHFKDYVGVEKFDTDGNEVGSFIRYFTGEKYTPFKVKMDANGDLIFGNFSYVLDKKKLNITDWKFESVNSDENYLNSLSRIDKGGAIGNRYETTASFTNTSSNQNSSGQVQVNTEIVFTTTTYNYENLLGTSGSDILHTHYLDDNVVSGAGDDLVKGSYGNDALNGGEGIDTVDYSSIKQVSSYNPNKTFVNVDLRAGTVEKKNSETDTISSFENVIGTDGSDTIIGDNNSNVINGLNGNDKLSGYGGNDTLSGGYGRHILEGGLGDDVLKGGDSGDFYIYNKGDGRDVINDFSTNSNDLSSIDTLIINGYTANDVEFIRSGNSLVIKFTNVDDQITIQNGFYLSARYQIEQFIFSDGTVLALNDIREKIISEQSSNGNDNISGFKGDDVFEAGLGDDYLSGGAGEDTYIFNRGDGQDVITENGYSRDTDKVFVHGYHPSEVNYVRNGEDVVITFLSSSDKITLKNSFYDNSIEEIHFDDGSIVYVDGLSDIILRNEATDGNDILLGSKAADVLEAGKGEDTLSGDHGSDTYVFNRGDGYNRIEDNGYFYDNEDSLIIRGYNPEDVYIERASNALRITFAGTTDKILITGYLYNNRKNGDHSNTNDQIEKIIFDDGTVWTPVEVKEMLLKQSSTDGDDFITGFSGTNSFEGGQGKDVLEGGLGNDTLNGWHGDDTYVFKKGDGQDTIKDSGSSYQQTDTLVIHGYDPEEVLREIVNDQLVLTFSGTTDKITLEKDLGVEIEQIVFDNGTIWTKEGVSSVNITTDGNDVLEGNSYSKFLMGGAGDDVLNGGDTRGHIIEGGLGNDTLSGGFYDDTFIFNKGDGNDILSDNSRHAGDKLIINGYNAADIILSQDTSNSDNLLIHFIGTNDSITILNTLTQSGNHNGIIEEVIFDDGSWSNQEIRDQLLLQEATDGDDSLSDIAGDYSGSIFEGGLGNDTLTGAKYADTYIFNKGDGQDTIIDSDSDNGKYYSDLLIIRGYSPSEVSLTHSENDMVFAFANTQDKIVIQFGWSRSDRRLEKVQFDDGTIWTSDDIAQKIISSTDGFDEIIGTNLNEVIDGQGGNDVIEGGYGGDILTGGSGHDTFVFTQSHGSDTITDFEAGLGFGDRIILRDITSSNAINTFEQLLEQSQELGNNTLINTGTGTITLVGVKKSDLNADDFLFGSDDPNSAPEVLSSVSEGSVSELVDRSVGEHITEHSISGNIVFADVDVSDTHSVSIIEEASDYLGTLTPTLDQENKTVSWSFSVTDAALDHLAEGESLTQVYTITIDDSLGGAVTQKITVTLTGSDDPNNAPVITVANNSTSVTENVDGLASENTATHTATGDIVFVDVDVSDTHSVSATAAASGYLGAFTPTIDQASKTVGWSFSVPDVALDHLAADDSLTQVYTVSIDDGQGGVVTQDVTVTITGSNDVPLITSADISASIAEVVDRLTGENSTIHTATGDLVLVEADIADMHSVTVTSAATGYLGVFTPSFDQMSKTVSWSFSVPDAALDHLAAGENLIQVYAVSIDDGQGGLVTQDVTVTIIGSDDPNAVPVITSADSSASVTEAADEGPLEHKITGDIVFVDADIADMHSVTVTSAATGYLGAFTPSFDQMSKTIGWSFSVPDTALDHLAAGESLIQIYAVSVNDEQGGVVTQDVSVTILGSNDTPLITTADSSASVIEIAGDTAATHTATGDIVFTDVDESDTHSITVTAAATGYLGAFTPSFDQMSKTVNWSFSVADAALDHLAAGENLIQVYAVSIDDGQVGIVTQDVTITITGSSDNTDGGVGDPQPELNVVNGDGGDNFIIGTDDNDLINGFGGYNEIEAGNGDDTIISSLGEDYVYGGAGKDTFVFRNETEAGDNFHDLTIHDFDVNFDKIVIENYAVGSFEELQQYIQGTPVGEEETFTTIEFVNGGIWLEGVDIYSLNASHFQFNPLQDNGGQGNSSELNVINGDDADNTIYGTWGNDQINGFSGYNVINAGYGDDTIINSFGEDFVSGGGGRDTFVFKKDVEANGAFHELAVSDYEVGSDTVVIEGYDINSFEQLQPHIFGTGPGEEWTFTYLSFDDGDIYLEGVNSASLSADDFRFV